MRAKRASAIVILLLVVILSIHTSSAANKADSTKNGLFLDKIVFQWPNSESECVQALLDDDIQAIDDTVGWEYLDELSEAESIRIAEIPRNGYGYLCINCQKYPFNLTAFRRAFSFAIDKERICDDTWEGHAYPQDSVVPRKSPWSIEEDLPYHYYESEISRANQILDHAGFDDIDGDSFREAPNGQDFNVTIEVSDSSEIAMKIGEIAETALEDVGIDAISVPTDFYEYLNRAYFHDDYDMVFIAWSFSDFDLDWLAYEYWSEYADKPYYNFPNFQNATFDSWKNQLLHATEYDKVYEAAREMQKILFYQCPIVPCYSNFEISAYRNDRFEGFVNDIKWGPTSFWSCLQAHLKESQGGPYGGGLHWGSPRGIDGFSILHSMHSIWLEHLLYDHLLRVGPNGHYVNWLARSYTIETHLDNQNIPSGHMRITFDLVRNATWTDGKPLTAEDVSFTFNYYQEAPGIPLGSGLEDMTAAYAEKPYTFVAEFNSTSYWLLHTIGYKPIIPKHVFGEIGLQGWNRYNPRPPQEPMITSGPFNVSDYVAGKHMELSHNPNYFYQYVPPSTANSTETTTTTNIFAKPLLTPLGTAVVIASLATIAGTGILWIREARDRN
ncbi:MAG: hypothetical protein KGY80_14290 [Candidatus Thorarchaeota archaeon]|nr:hypothetical protein [Candidatus Thorarchaeota archaeon]